MCKKAVPLSQLSIAPHGSSFEIPFVPRSTAMIIYRSDEAITDDEDRELRKLLFSCFSFNPVFLVRRYFKQRPGHRWLFKNEAGEIVAHAALHEKMIGTESGDLLVGGVADVCVATDHRGLGISKVLLQSMEQWLKARGIAFAMLFGRPRVYASSGYVPIQNELKAGNLLSWRRISLRGTPMVKSLSQTVWPRGVINLRGPKF